MKYVNTNSRIDGDAWSKQDLPMREELKRCLSQDIQRKTSYSLLICYKKSH